MARKGKKSEWLGEHQNGVSQPESRLAYLPKGHLRQVELFQYTKDTVFVSELLG